jgi:SAM-dependent methyltransferase
MSPVQVDLGCGNAKHAGYIGLDYVEMDQVDHVLDLTKDRYPFEDRSVDAVFSAHFLEHIDEPNHVFSEIGRIAKDGAKIEFWTPYAFTNEAFLYGHLHFLTEEMWMHFCYSHRDVFLSMLGGRWQLNRIVYNVPIEVAHEIEQAGFSLDFAIRYFKGVAVEFGVEIEFREDPAVPVVVPQRVWAPSRQGERTALVREKPVSANGSRSVFGKWRARR